MTIPLPQLSAVCAKLCAASRSGHALRSGLGRRLDPRLVLSIMAVLLLAGGIAGFRRLVADRGASPAAMQVGTSAGNRADLEPSLKKLRAANADLERQLHNLIPTGYNLIIDTAGNRVYLRRGEKIEAEMPASCGSGNILEDPGGGRRWVFDTPRGQFTVKSKITDPIWMKPDWAFIEEGRKIPTDPGERAEAGMMGDYALGLGQGYFIHGTLYTRLLGRNVSHGCVRLGDGDLERLYRSLPVGTRVLIF